MESCKDRGYVGFSWHLWDNMAKSTRGGNRAHRVAVKTPLLEGWSYPGLLFSLCVGEWSYSVLSRDQVDREYSRCEMVL